MNEAGVNEEGGAQPVNNPTVDDEVESASRELHGGMAEVSSAAEDGTHHEPDATAPNELIGCEEDAINGGANFTNGVVLDAGVLIVIGRGRP